ncbi:3-isopropylmalate dehydratase large subunit (EC 4.2.1.33) [uncultured Gammaproteobacteria bacterium]|jgi:3-isopropylmalate/(R)-2-methylmalate dehydratase large subunit|uniref:3-isopropylmalate dehydratase large subunit n=1 Tax=thiotrophic endosymbiont of Bathymodiolus puteoserpentis (Logatchev) TaxID=343240 RepID=UPI0010B02F01|nr:3-isopropylmalate dehydratase large subunit [thiotrophic endosymbiont of Bathymodiolus puteoserpentis (Logatchev)]CAC9499097.1 3-isopropylmalate dehydratase large subunit (EC 4.2.1.33) [uncultured Gammaproteobacteria bacterium]CAC9501727.1 3-isopropylmalate dehydratase large subunit (EC 4.2.1.33) [uncultured Gammaproteobacteria bacterium]CAC9507885.1 3-isopropylmalate dehydratase large subunit (EC 4.2.1.33) [uncultured Gammaproteobacteria bacterium]CAC9574349.1 3-isopropylmalate dehydratase 
MTQAQTLYDKLMNAHVVREEKSTALIYIDRQLIHEVTSPQAFEGLAMAGRKPWRLQANLAVPDHNVPTTNRSSGVNGITDPISKLQIETLDKNCKTFGINEIPMNDIRQGIVHVVGPEQGATLPGMSIVCGDSHTSTHGALGALAFGIGTSEVEHVLATGCLWQSRSKNLKIEVNGELDKYVSAKDVALYIIGKIGTAGGTGYAIEFSGSTIENLSIEGRMTLCNMAIEAGSRCGMIAVDDKTIDYVKGRALSPAGKNWDKAVKYWHTLRSDDGAHFDKILSFKANDIKPQVTWGTSPEMVIAIDEVVPNPKNAKDEVQKTSWENALNYTHLKADTKISDIKIDKVFIGSCTNSRIEDLRIAAEVAKGKHIASNIKLALVVPGSGLIKKQAEYEGLDKIFIDSGFEWREAGCSMCLAMNADKLEAGERCASTSNRNFEGRQGQGSFTHLVSPAIAAASAIAGHFSNV